jgi:hypothetical protein
MARALRCQRRRQQRDGGHLHRAIVGPWFVNAYVIPRDGNAHNVAVGSSLLTGMVSPPCCFPIFRQGRTALGQMLGLCPEHRHHVAPLTRAGQCQ